MNLIKSKDIVNVDYLDKYMLRGKVIEVSQMFTNEIFYKVEVIECYDGTISPGTRILVTYAEIQTTQ